jgi:hypothetical protein
MDFGARWLSLMRWQRSRGGARVEDAQQVASSHGAGEAASLVSIGRSPTLDDVPEPRRF